MKAISQEQKQKIFMRWDTAYRRLKTCNNDLLQKSNNYKPDDNNLIIDSLLFYISSFGMSYIKNLYLHIEDSIGNIVNARCIIEGFAILEHLKEHKNDPDKNNLLRLQAFILEKKTYAKYKSMDQKIFDLKSINYNYEKAKEIFKSTLDFNSKEFNYLGNSTIPFIGENTSYENLVAEKFGETFRTLYKLLSLLSHPHDGRNDFQHEKGLEDITEIILGFLEKQFSNYLEHKGGLETEWDNTLKYSPIHGVVSKQQKALQTVCEVLIKEGYASFGFLLYELSLMHWDFYLDLALGFTEHGTTKWKYYAELLGILYIASNNLYFAREAKMLYYHTQVQFEYLVYRNIMKSHVDQVYKEYLILYPNGVSKENFFDSYLKPLGFLIDENGNLPSLRKIVTDMLDHICPDIWDNKVTDGKNELVLSEYLKLKYDESQNMSHANGYMFFTPKGAWEDGLNVALYVDLVLEKILEVFLITEKKNSISGNKTSRNIIRNYVKKMKPLIALKGKFFASPKINKDF